MTERAPLRDHGKTWWYAHEVELGMRVRRTVAPGLSTTFTVEGRRFSDDDSHVRFETADGLRIWCGSTERLEVVGDE